MTTFARRAHDRRSGAARRAIALALSAGLLVSAAICSASVLTPASNTAPITINDAPPGGGVAKASLYPSVIHVSGITANTITKAQVILSDFNHTFPDDVDILLVAPDGTRSIVMSDAGGGNPGASHLQLVFSATASTAVPNDTAISDAVPLRPANYAAGDASGITDVFPSPGPGTLQLEPADFDVFNGINPNGDWSLYVVDDSAGDSGSILGGWTLVLTVPTVYTVTKVADTNDGTCNSDCSLREAIAAAGDGDLIRFASPLFDSSRTITLGGSALAISKSVTIQGPGAERLTISGNNASSVFSIPSGPAVTLQGMTIRDGYADVGGGLVSAGQLTLRSVALTGNKARGSGRGGAVYQTGNGNFVGCTFSDNFGVSGGAIFFAQPGQSLHIANSTISGNRGSASGESGGVEVFSGNATDVHVDIVNSTIADNRATYGAGGGISINTSGASSTAGVTLRNTIVANNTDTNISVVADGGAISVASLGFNLTNDASSPYLNDPTDRLGVDPQLGPLNNNGGHVETRALLGGSPALDAGHSSGYPKDVRGQSRSFDSLGAIDVPGDYSDIGAAEMHAQFVSTTADSDTGSLRQAMLIANANSPSPVDILFDPNVFATAQTINLAGALPDIATSLSVIGPGAKLLTVRRDTGGDYPVFNAPDGGYELALSGLTISNGHSINFGGGLSSRSRASVSQAAFTGNFASAGGAGLAILFVDGTIKDSTLNGNSTGGTGGGIFFQAYNETLRVSGSTISGNDASLGGGGLENAAQDGAPSRVEVVNSTITGNMAPSGGGVEVFSQDVAGSAPVVTLRNSIVANNTPSNLTELPNCDGCSADIVSRGYNLSNDPTAAVLDQPTDWIATDPLLRPLADNGGPTKTHALKPGSPALDSGDRSGSNSDQRGFVRPYDQPGVTNVSDGSDIGALEQDDTLFRDGFDG